MSSLRITLPEEVSFIINELQNAGHEAYAVGGCVRDSILGREPDDWDITTSASPFEVKNLFKRTVDTGIEHGTVTVMIGAEGFEVTTYRIDGKYLDGRHPDEVSFTKSLKEDLMRRDFTINAMAYNDSEGLQDLFEGQEDLKNRVIRCVGDPRKRFSEDYLRILRAVRFSAQLGFDIDASTLDAIRELAPGLDRISAERIRVELDKLICSDNPDRLITAHELGITAIVLPEFDDMMKITPTGKAHIYSVGVHCCESMKAIPKEPHFLRWAMLLHDIAKPAVVSYGNDGRTHFPEHAEKGASMAASVMRRLKFDNYSTGMVSRLILFHDTKLYDISDTELRKQASRIGPEYMDYLFMVFIADNTAKNPEGYERVMGLFRRAREQYDAILERGECLTIKQLAINGKDLLANGITEGRVIGETLERLLQMVLENPSLNTKEQLLELI